MTVPRCLRADHAVDTAPGHAALPRPQHPSCHLWPGLPLLQWLLMHAASLHLILSSSAYSMFEIPRDTALCQSENSFSKGLMPRWIFQGSKLACVWGACYFLSLVIKRAMAPAGGVHTQHGSCLDLASPCLWQEKRIIIRILMVSCKHRTLTSSCWRCWRTSPTLPFWGRPTGTPRETMQTWKTCW